MNKLRSTRSDTFNEIRIRLTPDYLIVDFIPIKLFACKNED